jgi:hypothetical protein
MTFSFRDPEVAQTRRMNPFREEHCVMLRFSVFFAILVPACLLAQSQQETQTVDGWQMQDSAKVTDTAQIVSTTSFHPQGWYAATVP